MRKPSFEILLVFVLFVSLPAVVQSQDIPTFDSRLLGTWERADGSLLRFVEDGLAQGANFDLLEDYWRDGKYHATAETVHIVFKIPWHLRWAADPVNETNKYSFEQDDILVLTTIPNPDSGEKPIKTRLHRVTMVAAN